MSTAQVALELVVAGVLGLLVLFLPWLGPTCGLEIASSALAVPALGVAYVLGVVFDKVFDRALAHDEAAVRWRVAHPAKADGEPKPDPFPQDAIEARLRRGEAASWTGYLRARTRLARALAVTAPLVGAALSLSLGRWGGARGCSPALDRAYFTDVPWLGLWPALALFVAVAVASRITPARTTDAQPPSAWPHVVVLVILHSASVVAILAALLGEGAAYAGGFRAAIALGGSLLGLAAGWAHGALQATYFAFLRSVRPALDGSVPAAAPSTALAEELEP